MAGYKTGAPELEKAAKDMEDSNQRLQQNISRLGQVMESTRGAWKGPAAGSFQTLMTRFQEDARKLNESLNRMAESVTGSAQSYRQQEEASQQSLSKLTQALGGE